MKMSPVKTKDPKTFIQNKAPPVPTHQGLRIQARSDTHYNCETPCRQDVFMDNYVRRQKQKSEQGYNSPNWKPYRTIGQPMHLDDKKMILHALGQLDENSLVDSSGSSDDDGDEGKEKDNDNKTGAANEEKKRPSRKFVVRRSSKTRKSLSKEVTVGRKMVNWTKLGHGVFSMIREQDEDKLYAEENERKLTEEQRRTEWQPPMIESSGDDETDEELAQEEDLSVFMDNSDLRKEVSFLGISSTSNSDIPTLSEDMQSRTTESRQAPTATSVNLASGPLTPAATSVNLTPGSVTPAGFTPTPRPPGTANTSRGRSGTKKKKKRRNLEDARPYTPCRTNISLEPYDDRPNRTALFRQLCALNWILEAMITEPPVVMEPIIKCWNIKYKDLKQNTFCKTTARKQRNDKALDTRWNSFVTNPGAGHLRAKPINKFGASLTASSAALMSSNRTRKMSVASGTVRRSGLSGSVVSQGSENRDEHASRTSRRGSVVSRQDGSPSGRRESVATKGIMGNAKCDGSPKRDGTREFSRGLTKFLDEIYESASNPGAKPINEGDETRDRSPSVLSDVSTAVADTAAAPHTDNQQATERGQGSSNKSTNNKSRPILSAKQLEERSQHVNKPPEQQVSRWVTNTTLKLHSRARSAPSRDPKSAFPSQKLKHLPTNLRNKFADVAEDNALTLHDKLEGLEKRRLWRSEEKFRAIRTNLHISAQLELLKHAGQEPEDDDDKQRLKMEEESKWFQELMHNLPRVIIRDRQCFAVIEKLQSMGKIESRKVTPQKFLDVLATLKTWELCAPDISAAIEFVRDKVVGMTVEDFEAWYQSEVPGIVRSQSVPLF